MYFVCYASMLGPELATPDENIRNVRPGLLPRTKFKVQNIECLRLGLPTPDQEMVAGCAQNSPRSELATLAWPNDPMPTWRRAALSEVSFWK